MIWIVLIMAALVVRFQYPRLKRNGQKKELAVSACLLAAAVTLSMLQSFRVELPNPLDWLTVVYKPLSKAVLSMLN
ncbi:hypothetical protein SAMN02799624_03644 [Paenibacillus sp. UNC496MF]|uniref:hypothetical protein n=1 Tax=Paenibacillus sp. UNC496MF TaxID=1502753 RepID=UPI0008EA182B|nr:hypothetical protein [Paenibacillus sp. UNC496MF]SFJ21570.1 hypothetical protein SAMN02799624_03644 [Paenibacillus sp. UNC496MF]